MTKFLMVFIAAATVFFLSCNSTDCPVCPEPELEPVDSIGDYNFYISDTGGDSVEYIYIYNTLAGKITDSIRTEYWPYDNMAVSPDGRYLILGGGDTFIIDTETKELLDRKYQAGRVLISPSGKYIGVWGNAFWIFDGETFEEISVDTTDVFYRAFDRNEDVLYTLYADLRLTRYDIASDLILSDYQMSFPDYEGWRPVRLVPTDDPKKVYLTLLGDRYFFVVVSYRFDTGEVGLHYTVSTVGDLLITPDGSTLVGTNPASVIGPPLPLNKSAVFFVDIETDLITSLVGPLSDEDFYRIIPSTGAISPDGLRAVFAGVRGVSSPYSVMDLTKPDFIYHDTTHFIDGEHVSMMVACKRNP